jgi:hypothetical protein
MKRPRGRGRVWRRGDDGFDMAFSLETKRYLPVYGAWSRGEDDHLYANWATERMAAMQSPASGARLADENLGRRGTPFMKNENLARLDSLRRKYDSGGLFRAYLGRPDL